MKRSSASSGSRAKRRQMTWRFSLTPNKWCKLQRGTHLLLFGKRQLIYHWWQGRQLQPFWRGIWQQLLHSEMGFILDSATPLLRTPPVDIKRPEQGEGIYGRALAARSWESKKKPAFGLHKCCPTQFVNSERAPPKTKLESALPGSAQDPQPHWHHLGLFKHPDLQTTPQSRQIRVLGARAAVFCKPRPAGDSKCSQSRSYSLRGMSCDVSETKKKDAKEWAQQAQRRSGPLCSALSSSAPNALLNVWSSWCGPIIIPVLQMGKRSHGMVPALAHSHRLFSWRAEIRTQATWLHKLCCVKLLNSIHTSV